MIFAFLFCFLFQSQEIKPEYRAQLDRTYYTGETTATDASGHSRRVVLLINHQGRARNGELGYMLSLELRAVATGKEFEETVSATCDGKQLFKRDARHWLSTFDAETPKANVQLLETEASVLALCQSPKLVIAGIPVTLSKEQMQPIRAVVERARR